MLEAARYHDPDGAWLVDPARFIGADGAWMIGVDAVDDPCLVGDAVRAELIGPVVAQGTAVQDVVAFLRRRRALLVLDGCDRLVEACARLTGDILRSCADVRILVTSRRPLGVTGEVVWRLTPLRVPARGDADLASVAAAESVQLFVERATAVNPAFSLTGDNAASVAEICRRLDGLPLAVELAAARTVALSAGEVLDRLDGGLGLLCGGGADGQARHRSLRTALAWSNDLLSPGEAALLRRLSVFAGGFALGAAEAVCADGTVPRDHVLDLLSSLVARSLVTAEQTGDATRYRMLETTRAYARIQLDAATETEDLVVRHGAWCLARATEATGSGEEATDDARACGLDEDHENFLAALGRARARGRADFGLRLANGLAAFWQTRGHLREGLGWLAWALAAADDAPPVERAWAMRHVGRFTLLLGDHPAGLALIDRSVELFRSLGEDNEADGCVCAGVGHMCENPLYAIPMMEANLEVIRAMGEPDRLAHALCALGQARIFRGDATGARACFAEVLTLPPADIDDAGPSAVFGLARVAVLVGRYDAADTHLAEVRDHARRVADPELHAAALSLSGEAARGRGNTRRARALLTEALHLAHRAGVALSVSRCELFMARVEYAEGALEPALALYEQALRRTDGGATLAYNEVRCLLGLADVAAAAGREAEAAAGYADAQNAAETRGDDQAVARAMAGRADLARAAGDVAAALRLRHAALEIDERIGDLPAIVGSLAALAALAAADGSNKAARLFGAADALRNAFGFALPAPLRCVHEAEVERARSGLSAEAWREAWEQGGKLSLEQALDYARRGRGRRRRPTAGPESLTAAERAVMGLASDGMTNRQIGERLFISPRTVQRHLEHVYAKLGIHSRRQLPRHVPGTDPVIATDGTAV